MDPEAINFSPEEMAGFDRAAVKPYLQTTQFTEREGRNYSSKTELRKNVRVSLDKNSQLHLLVLEWRNGVVGVRATLWSCHEGEGAYIDGNTYGLNESFDIGFALFPAPGPSEDDVFDMWTYVNESEKIFNSPVDFAAKHSQLSALFRSRVASRAQPWPEPQNESAVRLVRIMLGEEDDMLQDMGQVAAKPFNTVYKVIAKWRNGHEQLLGEYRFTGSQPIQDPHDHTSTLNAKAAAEQHAADARHIFRERGRDAEIVVEEHPLLGEATEGDEDLMRQLAATAAGAEHEILLAMDEGRAVDINIPAPVDNSYSLEIQVRALEPGLNVQYSIPNERRARMLVVKWTHRVDMISQYSWKSGGGWSWYLPESFPRLGHALKNLFQAAAHPSYGGDEHIMSAYSALLSHQKQTAKGTSTRRRNELSRNNWIYATPVLDRGNSRKRNMIGRRGQNLLPR